MGHREVLTATGAVKIDHRLSQIAVTVRRAQETLARHKRSLCDEQAARLDALELSLSGTLASAKLSIQLFQSVRPFLRPMDAAEHRLIEELVDSGFLPNVPKRP
ncbi:hypothetical protein QCE73_08785 [Caballeronia sp. LZ029]|uniref:hypothetical protein n=1 Tax=Caballeronia sp. LZ029 TaxID=3038564 RepID=UPI0028569C11|nr:hypothetical protein [Caballeronia sp. LZ029]MDR5743249.1 hypothetical protein [Caballeronia sp. LZ029]